MRAKIGLETILAAGVAIILVLACIWIFVGIRLDLWSPAQYSRYRWLVARMPVAPAFWHGQIKAGDDANKIARTWPPQIVNQFGPWAELEWFPYHHRRSGNVPYYGIEAIAENGRLVFASSYAADEVDAMTFFDAMTPATRANYQAWQAAYVEGRLTPRINPMQTGKPRRH